MDSQYLEQFSQSLTVQLLKKLSDDAMLDGTLLEIEELEEVWDKIAPEYMADAVPNLVDYPSVAIAWAAYYGMAMAAAWDGAWDEYKEREDIYTSVRDVRGFDCMDEYILEEMLGISLTSPENIKLEAELRSLAQIAITTIRKEQIEGGTTEAFYVFAATAKVFFKVGVAIELKQLGYSYQKVTVDVPQQEIN